jgi:uncharacterized protein (DUF305 family)
VTSEVQVPGGASVEAAQPPASGRQRLTVVLTVIVALTALVIAVAVGHVWGASGNGSSLPSAASVDAGFARDMSTHHQQAITMAGYTRDNTDNPAIKVLAFDIETSQEFQVGEMQGWLDVWGLSRESSQPVMGWMSGHAHLADGQMPGLATPAQMSKLETLHGSALDKLFLQLMIHHNQGGLQMATDAAAHAGNGYVRDLAQSMVTAQSGEIVQMERLLRQMGGAPLPPPED